MASFGMLRSFSLKVRVCFSIMIPRRFFHHTVLPIVFPLLLTIPFFGGADIPQVHAASNPTNQSAKGIQSAVVRSSPLPGEVGSPSLSLNSFTVESLLDKVHIRAGLVLGNTVFVRGLLRDGAVMTMTCKIKVQRLRTVLANENVAELLREYHLRHDPLTREFVMDYGGNKPQRQKHLDSLVSSFWEEIDFVLPLKTPLVSGETYRVTIELTLQHAEVPPWLEKALFFWSWDVVPPVSFTQEFVY